MPDAKTQSLLPQIARIAGSAFYSMGVAFLSRRAAITDCNTGMIAALLGNDLAVVLYERITAQLLSGTPALDLKTILLWGSLQLALLVISGGIWTHSIADRNLMQRTATPRLRPAAAPA